MIENSGVSAEKGRTTVGTTSNTGQALKKGDHPAFTLPGFLPLSKRVREVSHNEIVPAGEREAGEFAIGDLRFQLTRLLDADLDTHEPAKLILFPLGDDPLMLHDEELQRAGLEVSRTYQYTRWVNGNVHLWSGRNAGIGRGEGPSGLRFDLLEDPSIEEVSQEGD